MRDDSQHTNSLQVDNMRYTAVVHTPSESVCTDIRVRVQALTRVCVCVCVCVYTVVFALKMSR